ncbi:unnamed protein product [Moneuplotes crassus]|uniref:Uncharacterized protein n=1 Tax=Euplotes crassus TaxID=5936 RepID=A0AAD1XJ17_EUPCR|nr:unnamed protein product [Moneuplotes crassus]
MEDKQRLEEIREKIFNNYRPIDQTFDLVLSMKDILNVNFIQEACGHKFPSYYFLAVNDLEKCKKEDQEALDKFLPNATAGGCEQLELSCVEKYYPEDILPGICNCIPNITEEVHLDSFTIPLSFFSQIILSSLALNTLKIMNCKIDATEEPSLSETPSTDPQLETIFLSGSLPGLLPSEDEKIEEDHTEVSLKALHEIIKILKHYSLHKCLQEVKVEETDLCETTVQSMFTEAGFSVEVEHW